MKAALGISYTFAVPFLQLIQNQSGLQSCLGAYTTAQITDRFDLEIILDQRALMSKNESLA